MKKFIFVLFVISLLSCNKEETDVLTNTVWESENIKLSFAADKQVVCDVNNALDWVGVYVLYENNSILIYKAIAGDTDNYVLTYTGTVNGDVMNLYDEDEVLVILIKK